MIFKATFCGEHWNDDDAVNKMSNFKRGKYQILNNNWVSLTPVNLQQNFPTRMMNQIYTDAKFSNYIANFFYADDLMEKRSQNRVDKTVCWSTQNQGIFSWFKVFHNVYEFISKSTKIVFFLKSGLAKLLSRVDQTPLDRT